MNKITVSGRLTHEVEFRYTPAGKAMCRFSIAVDRPFSKEKKTDFFNVVVWGKLAEICGNNLDKGRKVVVDGIATMDTYTGKDGQKRSRFEINAQTVEFMDSRSAGGNTGGVAANFDDFGSGAEQGDIDF